MQLDPPQAVLDIAQKLNRSGHDVWAVGGAIRDTLLGLPSGDWDLATSARPEQVRGLFRRTFPIGIAHGTVGVLGSDGVLYEVTTFRRDVETTGRHAVVEFAETIDEDLARRDFTFNAIAWHPIRDEVRDPFHGIDDLKNAMLRTVGAAADRFAEDWLRVLRALRFAGHFVLRIDDATWTALRASAPRLTQLSAERVREELFKILSKTPHASAALELYREAGVLEVLYPELHALADIEDAWLITLRAVDALPPTRPLLRMAALLHATGMPAARARDLRGGWRYTGHPQFGGHRARDVMERLKASNADTDSVARMVARQADLFPPDAPDAGVRRWLMHVPPRDVNDFFRFRIALWRANPTERGDRDIAERWRHVRRVLAANPALSTGDLAINGADLKLLGLKPGPRFGEILTALHQRVIDDPALNDKAVLTEMARKLADAASEADHADDVDSEG